MADIVEAIHDLTRPGYGSIIQITDITMPHPSPSASVCSSQGPVFPAYWRFRLDISRSSIGNKHFGIHTTDGETAGFPANGTRFLLIFLTIYLFSSRISRPSAAIFFLQVI